MKRRACVVALVLGVGIAGCVVERDLGTTSAADAGTAPAPRSGSLVFVTEGRFTGDLAREGGATTGALGADELCALEARGAGLAGVFGAWLTTGTEEASARVGALGPYRRVDGTTVFPGKAPVGAPLVSLSITARGATVGPSDDGAVWTGSANRRCAGFTSGTATDLGAIGSALASDTTWTSDGAAVRACNERARLYCFQR